MKTLTYILAGLILSVSFCSPAIAAEEEKTEMGVDFLTRKTEEADTVRNALLYEQLGNAYIRAKLYNEALVAYDTSLSYDDNSATVHYSLGLLYQYLKNDRVQAIAHLKKSLRMRPALVNRKQVENLISMLENDYAK